MLHMLEARHRRLASAPLRMLADLGRAATTPGVERLQAAYGAFEQPAAALESWHSASPRSKASRACTDRRAMRHRTQRTSTSCSSAPRSYQQPLLKCVAAATSHQIQSPGATSTMSRSRRSEGAGGCLIGRARCDTSHLDRPAAHRRWSPAATRLSTLRCLRASGLYLAWRATARPRRRQPTTRALLTQLTFAQGLARACLDAALAPTPRGDYNATWCHPNDVLAVRTMTTLRRLCKRSAFSDLNEARRPAVMRRWHSPRAFATPY